MKREISNTISKYQPLRRFVIQRYVVALLGMGGVGKTTFAYRILGIPDTPVLTLRPSYYRIYLGDLEIDLIDVPGQRVFEVALKFASFKMTVLDKAIYMYDVTNYETLYSLLELHSIFIDRGIQVAKEIVVVGNKMDLAAEAGFYIEAEEVASAIGAKGVYYISATKDPPRKLLEIILGKAKAESYSF